MTTVTITRLVAGVAQVGRDRPIAEAEVERAERHLAED